MGFICVLIYFLFSPKEVISNLKFYRKVLRIEFNFNSFVPFFTEILKRKECVCKNLKELYLCINNTFVYN